MRRARHGYYAAISYLDERVGEVLDALSATGLDRDTIVIFTSDHGELLGERGLWYKMSFLEASARVPLIVRGPGIRATARRGPGLAARPRPHARRAGGRAGRRGRVRGPQPGGRARRRARARRGLRGVPRRGRPRARRDDPARALQVRPLPRRSRSALRPRGRPARAPQPRGRAGAASSSQRRSGRRATSAGTSRSSSAGAREPANAAPRRTRARARRLRPLGLPAVLRRIAPVRAQRGRAGRAPGPLPARRRTAAVRARSLT